MPRDARNCFERVWQANDALFCGAGSLPERLESALKVLVPLLLDDFPTEELKQKIAEVRWELTREEDPTESVGPITTTIKTLSESDQRRISKLILSLYTQAARLESDRSDPI